ncbi:MAG TPA: T9SS type A sorting domain-containing protein, partial [Chitinophagales bacterium]|nr:T9SS type A sorting domain-containing protein [Chitinophagales bacterium]
TVYTDQYGHYCAVVPAGTYIITIVHSNTTAVTPGSITVVATTNGNTYGNNNFAIYSQPSACNLAITITPNSDVSPGYPAWYEIQVCNLGSGIASGDVNMFYDPSLHYNYASPAPTSQNSTTYTVSWALNNLMPGNCQYYWVSLRADSTLPVGQFIFTLANVTTNGCNDADMSNNVDTLHQSVSGSWDPNDKQVTPLGDGPQGNISPDQELYYTVNFQNTGNAPAVNVVVHDSISDNLDIATFKMRGASAPYTMQFNGRMAIWRFSDIMLPDSSVDEQASHGFVSFSIKPLSALASGTQIHNTAGIYFDYNAGVNTNTTLNTIDYALSIDQLASGNVTITLQPNPFSDFTTIRINGAEGPYELEVYDLAGRKVMHQTNGNNFFSIQRGDLASGMYMYEVMQSNKVIGKGKMIAQ